MNIDPLIYHAPAGKDKQQPAKPWLVKEIATPICPGDCCGALLSAGNQAVIMKAH